VGGIFSVETISFVVQKLFNFMKSHLSILSFSCWVTGVLPRSPCLYLLLPEYSLLYPVLTANLGILY
jgi:hypothetical protein